MKQLFANNAKAILASPINATDTSIVVDDASKFPSPGSHEFFLVTLVLGSSLEIIMITARSGNTLTVGGLGRGCEGTTAGTFSSGTLVEVRVTRDSLDRKSTQLYPTTSLDLIVAPQDSYNAGYVANSYDPFGNPAILFAKNTTTWRFFNYTEIATFTATAATTTSISATSITLNALTSGKYIVQFTSGIYSGQVRAIISCSSNTINWATALGGAPSVGDTFEVLEANISMLQDALMAVALPVAYNTGSANVLAGTYFPALTSFNDNEIVGVVISSTNTSPTVTFTPNALTAKPVVGRGGLPLEPGDLAGTVLLRYDLGSDKWWLVSAPSRNVLTALSFFIGNF